MAEGREEIEVIDLSPDGEPYVVEETDVKPFPIVTINAETNQSNQSHTHYNPFQVFKQTLI